MCHRLSDVARRPARRINMIFIFIPALPHPQAPEQRWAKDNPQTRRDERSRCGSLAQPTWAKGTQIVKAVLVRIGVDHSFGEWNAPANPKTGEFIYVPIPEKQGTAFHPGCERRYEELEPMLRTFAEDAGLDLLRDLKCPPDLLKRPMHLDPDFDHLTYGDVGDRRGSHMRKLREDDLLVFYAGLRPCTDCEHKLIYALVGLYVVQEVVDVASVAQDRWGENAHTRKKKRGSSDIIVRAKPAVSGRFKHFIPIGEYRDGAYRVRTDILEEWGGLTVKDGYIQSSAVQQRHSVPTMAPTAER